MLVIAASVAGYDDALKTYEHLATSYPDLLRDSSDYYRNYLAHTVNLALPDPCPAAGLRLGPHQRDSGTCDQTLIWARDWVAGYRTSGASQRPAGLPGSSGATSFWTSFALNAAGTMRRPERQSEFIGKYQRDDGKIPHEIAQGANFRSWFKDFPYPYASADRDAAVHHCDE